ncbi:WD repeat-containing protein 44-like [Trifolium pratense]|uniref:WD repeat-containing protein 44-like n=3 Tax=Trifolium pratense TaxID=57577 RepID=A0A2K3NFL7_TRIPR|nr:WD repeat-containing protein 44-like [Trifolium pratense]
MLSSDDDGDIDVFYDSLDSLSGQDSVLAELEVGFERRRCDDYDKIWLNELVSVKERRERFLKGMCLVDNFSKICLQERIMSFDDSSITSGMERIAECSGAVSNACISPSDELSEKVVFSGWNAASEAEVLFKEIKGRREDEVDASFQEYSQREGEAQEEFRHFDKVKANRKNWWKRFVNIRKNDEGKVRSKLNTTASKTRRIKVRQNKKRWLEFSELYIGQEIKAHKGLIWTMKFSPNGKYLASGGEDGVVRIWRIMSRDKSPSFIFIQNDVFQIDESPLQELFGHSSDILDLAWSNSDILLSSSMDKTVCCWKIGCDQCLSVFPHKDFVTCIQFNPVDENYFISGSIDGKVRIWGIREERVIDWADIRDVISAISYQQDGKGFVVGSVTGTCRFYVASGKYFKFEAQIGICGKKKASGNKITGIQFFQNNRQRIMITSEDSKIHILDGIEIVQKYKGLPRSGSQMSGSFTSSGKHIISVGGDSRVYIWNFNDSKSAKAEDKSDYRNNFSHHSSETKTKLEFSSEVKDTEQRFSLGNWFFIDGTCRGSMTWPEEKLPTWDLPLVKDEYDRKKLYREDSSHDRNNISETWGLTIVAAGSDGTIKTFHNFGLPVRL